MPVVHTNENLNIVRNAIHFARSPVAIIAAGVTLEGEMRSIRKKLKVITDQLPKRNIFLRWLGPAVTSKADARLMEEYNHLKEQQTHGMELRHQLLKSI